MSCAKCERPFRYGTEDTVTINRKTYHSDCLSCDQCSKPYDGSFLPDDLDREALCRECTRKQKPKSAAATRPKSSEPAETKAPANRCGGCGLPFNPASRHITKRYKNREYHHNCLKCHQCQALIEGEIYEDEQGNQIFCTSCFKSHDQKSFQRQNQEKKRNQQKSVHFAEKLAETLNRDELAAFYKNESGRNHDEFMMGNEETGEIAFCAACMLPFHNGSRITQANDRDYHYECFTCEKCSQPINGVFTMNAEGSRFQCGKCLQKSSSSSSSAGSSLRLCVECNRPIDPQQHGRIEMNHRFYHSDCFVCAICRRRLNPSQTYSIFNDQPWCRQCEDKTKSCYNCRKPVIDTGITYETRDYHVECFRCSQCGKSLEHEEILCANDLKPFCSPCHDDLFAKRCAKCRRPIPSNTKYPVVDEKPYHDQCFLCTKCHRPIGSKKFFKDQRGFICSNCG